MSRKEIMNILTDIFREEFDDEDLVIDEEITADDIEDWDSLAQIALIHAIEVTFDIKFLTEEIQKLACVGDMADLIMEYKK